MTELLCRVIKAAIKDPIHYQLIVHAAIKDRSNVLYAICGPGGNDVLHGFIITQVSNNPRCANVALYSFNSNTDRFLFFNWAFVKKASRKNTIGRGAVQMSGSDDS